MQCTTAATTTTTKHPLPQPPPASKELEDSEVNQLNALFTQFDWAGDEVEGCTRVIMDPNANEQAKFYAINQLRQLLCTTRENVYKIAQDVIDSGVLEGLVRAVSNENPYDSLRHPAAFCLTNVAAGSDEQTAAVVKAGAIPVLIQALRSDEEVLRRQAIFCLANIAGATNEFRQELAKYPDYFRAIVYSFMQATDVKVEELAGWNVRNMIVLGGPSFEELELGIEFFTSHLQKNVPPPDVIMKRMINGTASIQGAFHGTRCSSEGGSTLLRFACETFSVLSRSEKGREFIGERDLALTLLYHGKFSGNHNVRNYSLEAVVNVTRCGGSNVCLQLLRCGALIGLSELLADYITYSPHQRILAAQAIFYLCQSPRFLDVASMAEPHVLTVANAKIFLDERQTRLTSLRSSPCSIERMDFDDYTMETNDEYVDPENRMNRNSQTTAGYLISGMDVALDIFTQKRSLEELALREKCGRILVTCFNELQPIYILRALTPPMIDLMFDILDLAVDIESRQTPPAVNEVPYASALNALTPGEPGLSHGNFVLSTIGLFEKLATIGESLMATEGAIENPVIVLIRQEGGIQRFEACLSKAYVLPYEIIEKAMQFAQIYL